MQCDRNKISKLTLTAATDGGSPAFCQNFFIDKETHSSDMRGTPSPSNPPLWLQWFEWMRKAKIPGSHFYPPLRSPCATPACTGDTVTAGITSTCAFTYP